jgi:O-acetyl-ADP-ribose deacetylase (regulator of RNase III)
MARAREHGVRSIAFPALGTGVGGYPLDEAARLTVATVHDELARSPGVEEVIFALRGAEVYRAFEAALQPAPGHETADATDIGVEA